MSVICDSNLGNMVTNVCAKFNYDLLHVDKVLGNLKSDNKMNKHKNNKKKKNNVHSTWGPFLGPKMILSGFRHDSDARLGLSVMRLFNT